MGTLYLYCSLPPIEMGSKPDFSSKELYSLMQVNLSSSGFRKVGKMRLWIDLNNLYAGYFAGQFDSRGLYSRSQLKELITAKEKLPEYVFDFFEEYEDEESRRKELPRILSRYFQEEKESAGGFVQKFLEFEHKWRIVMAGYRAKQAKTDMLMELGFEDLNDDFVASVIAQSGSSGKFNFPYEFKELEEKLMQAGDNPKKQQYALANYRFQFYAEYMEDHQFTLGAIVAYMMMLWILEDYFALSKEAGLQILDDMVENRNAS